MTLQLAMLNRSAVALASDATATVSSASENRARGALSGTRVSKIAVLPPPHSVGLLVYGRAEFMGVPWSSILAHFGEHAGACPLPTVADYGEALIAHLARLPIAQSAERRYVRERVSSGLEVLRRRSTEAPTRASLQDVARWWASRSFACGFDARQENRLIDRHANVVDAAIETVFPGQLARDRPLLRRIAARCVTREAVTSRHSGIVVAGFGRTQLFPAALTLLVEGKVGRTVSHAPGADGARLNDRIGAAIVPLARAEFVDGILDGMDPRYLPHLKSRKNDTGATAPGGELRDLVNRLSVQPMLRRIESVGADDLGHIAQVVLQAALVRRALVDDSVGVDLDVECLTLERDHRRTRLRASWVPGDPRPLSEEQALTLHRASQPLAASRT